MPLSFQVYNILIELAKKSQLKNASTCAFLLQNEHSNSYQTYPKSILHRISPLRPPDRVLLVGTSSRLSSRILELRSCNPNGLPPWVWAVKTLFLNNIQFINVVRVFPLPWSTRGSTDPFQIHLAKGPICIHIGAPVHRWIHLLKIEFPMMCFWFDTTIDLLSLSTVLDAG